MSFTNAGEDRIEMVNNYRPVQDHHDRTVHVTWNTDLVTDDGTALCFSIVTLTVGLIAMWI